jgi:hypothetical protein
MFHRPATLIFRCTDQQLQNSSVVKRSGTYSSGSTFSSKLPLPSLNHHESGRFLFPASCSLPRRRRSDVAARRRRRQGCMAGDGSGSTRSSRSRTESARALSTSLLAGDGDASGGGPMWLAGGDGGDSRPEIGAAPSGRVDLVHDRLVPGLHHFFPVNGSSLGGPVGGCSGRPAAGTRLSRR